MKDDDDEDNDESETINPMTLASETITNNSSSPNHLTKIINNHSSTAHKFTNLPSNSTDPIIQSCSTSCKNSATATTATAASVVRNSITNITDTNMVLLNIFLINKKRYRVLFHSGVLVWEPEHSNKKTADKKSVSIYDIITIKLQQKQCCQLRPKKQSLKKTSQPTIKKKEDCGNKSIEEAAAAAATAAEEEETNCDCERIGTIPLANVVESCAVQQQQQQQQNSSFHLPMTSAPVSKHFIIYYGRRRTNKESDKWSVRHITMENADCRIIHLWFQTIQNELNEQTFRPKRILMFINPFGGKQQALNIYEKYGKPIFKLANVDVNVVVSQRPNQIRDIILTQSLAHFDGIACVGGDGTFSEVFNGLIYRTINDLGLDPLRPAYIPKPTLPIGIIPGGSTDTVAYCIHGTIDIPTCVLHIVFGQRRGLDLASVSNKNGLLRLYASVMSYGYLGDIALDSEKFRWMGPKRYDYSGIKKFFANKGYEGELSILLNDDDPDPDEGEHPVEDEEEKGENDQKWKNIENNPNIGPGCYENCERCFNSTRKFQSMEKVVINFEDVKFRKSMARTNKNDCNQSSSSPINKPKTMKWKIIRGKFFMVNGANLSCACARSPNGFSKYCHIGDGCVDLVLIRHTNLINNLKLLLAMSSKNSKISELPFVEIYRTRKFYFRNCTTINKSRREGERHKNITVSISSDEQTENRPNNDDDAEDEDEDDVDMDLHQNQHEFNSSTQPITDNINSNCCYHNQNHEDNQRISDDVTTSSNWNCDGEVIQDSDIVVRSHCQLVDMYMRGRFRRDNRNVSADDLATSPDNRKLSGQPGIITTGNSTNSSCRNQTASVTAEGGTNNYNTIIDDVNPPHRDCKSFLTCGML